MSLEFLNDYVILVVLGICYCVGYAIKNFLPTDNKYIPLIMLCLGVVVNIWLNEWLVTPAIVLGGMASGLASTGTNQLFKQLSNNEVIEK